MRDFTWRWEAMPHYYRVFLDGLSVTIQLSVAVFCFAIVGGMLIGIARHSERRILNWPATAFIEIFRNTPILVQLVWFYYALPVVLDQHIDGFSSAVIAIGCNTMAYFAEIFRAGIQSVERGRWEAGYALGMHYPQVMRRIVLPLTVRRMLPAFANRVVEAVKGTSLASTIAVGDLMFRGQELANTIYMPFEVYTVVAGMYFLAIYPLILASYWLERRLALTNGVTL
ncbi:amino acid ABC transporter permease [Xanthobacter sp. VNH20]|uniref:amino acid ABC transporter permease n=1 Tax=Xanthobacter sp. VNH20 TaxID=3156616 RepID=UPI0032B466E2